MPLKLRLKPDEQLVVNGCVIQNGNRRHTLTIKNFAQVIRGDDLIAREEADTPAKIAYFLIQNVLIDQGCAKDNIPAAQRTLAKLYATFIDEDAKGAIMEAANHMSVADYYKALSSLRPVLAYEAAVIARAARARDAAEEPAG